MTFVIEKPVPPEMQGRIVISVSMPTALGEALIELAEIEGLTKSALCAQMLRYALDSMEGDDDE